MKKIASLLTFILLIHYCNAQPWVQKNSNPLTNSGRTRGTAFAINGIGYFLGGSDDCCYHPTDAFAYNPTTNSWSSIASFPNNGAPNGKVVGVVDTLAYVGLGVGPGYTWSNLWYSYSPKTNKWTPRKNYPETPRAYACSFTINGKIYVAGGSNGNNLYGHADFYMYDPSNDSWTNLGYCPAAGVNAFAAAFAIGDTGYVGTGERMDSVLGTQTCESDFWKYDPNANTWTQIAYYPGGKVASFRAQVRSEAVTWATCDRGYVGGGYDTGSISHAVDSTFYEYNPLHNSWTQIPNFTPGGINGAQVFVIGETAYINGGQRDSISFNRDFIWVNSNWAFTKAYIPTFTIGGSNSSTICTGQSITFNDTSNFAPTNWKWSFKGGKPDTSNGQSQTVEYDSAGTFNVTLTAYNSCDSGTFTYTNYVTVGVGGTLTVAPSSDSICSGQSIMLNIEGGSGKGSSFTWAPSAGLSATTGDTVTANPTITTTYVVTGAGGCTATGMDTVIVNTSPPALDIEPQGYALCSGATVILYVAGGGSDFTWNPATGLSASTGDSVIASPTADVTYTVTGTTKSGCSSTGTDIVSVIPAPNKPTITLSVTGDSLISSATQGNQWYFNDTLITGATNQDLIITGQKTGSYTVQVLNPANGCTATSDSLVASSINQLAAISNQLSIYPNPSTGSITITSTKNINALSVTNLLGQTVLKSPLGNLGVTHFTFELKDEGMYFVTVTSGNERATKKIVVCK